MKNYSHKTRRFLNILFVIPVLIATEFVFFSCSHEELEIQQNFPFDVSIMPVPKDISKHETVEIRITIKSAGQYKDAQYYLRYFQFEGTGTLQFHDHLPYSPNDSYPIPDKEFRLYYTSTSQVSQVFSIWFSDQFGNEKEVKFQFGHKE